MKNIGLYLLLLPFALLVYACSQEEVVTIKEGTITGTLKSTSGKPIPSTAVTLLDSKGSVDGVQTDASGKFTFQKVKIGSYTINIIALGYKEVNQAITVTEVPATADIVVERRGLPSGGTLGSKVVSFTSTSVVFDVNVFVVDGEGKPLTLNANAFTIAPSNYQNNNGLFTLTFNQQSITTKTGVNAGPYSAALVLDQSGSIAGTDPNDSRLQAARSFLGSLGTGDNVSLMAFASQGSLPFDITRYGTGFLSDGTKFYPNLDELAKQVAGGTPLYKATYNAVDYTAANAPNANKAVIIFTDGMDTDGGFTIDQIVANANSKNVKIFTVGLSTSVDTFVLGEIAQRGNGAFIWADDADQLISAYKNLGNLLHGTAANYQLRFTASANKAVFPAKLTVNMKVITPTITVTIPFYVEAK